jgi:hypothetical protein
MTNDATDRNAGRAPRGGGAAIRRAGTAASGGVGPIVRDRLGDRRRHPDGGAPR